MSASAPRNYDEDKDLITEFLRTFNKIDSNGNKHFLYSEQMTNVANREQTVMYVALDDVADFSEELASAVESNAARYQKLFAECVDKLLPDFRTVDEITNPTFMPLTLCGTAACKNAGAGGGGRLHLQTRGSKFAKFQEIRIQELSDQVCKCF
ncbi:unnamed protein product [Echinostoma caproni]|uniref:MCM_N domain-containing protein n=1 Tax=Echinostoma caproni TaxID=27848 RepID=A0A183BA84_9TREM|nr:unnamed protein product [Echinostoma caproni]